MSANKFCHHVAFVVIVFFFSSFTAPFASAMKTAMKTAVNTNIDASPVHPVETFLVLTVAAKEEDSAFKRFLRSVNINNLPTKVLVKGTTDEERKTIPLLLQELEMHKDHSEMIVMFANTLNGDTLVNGERESILRTFQSLDARVVFSANDSCWPDESLVSQYPEVEKGQRFLNSALFIGYASDLYKILSEASAENIEDEQLFFTKTFLDEKKREQFKIKLDQRMQLFQNLKWSDNNDVFLISLSGKEMNVSNNIYKSHPLVFHASGPFAKLQLRALADYIPKAWNIDDGCISCLDDMISLEQIKTEDYPLVVVAIFVEKATPFMEEFWQKFVNLVYPKDKIRLVIYNKAAYHSNQIERFIAKQGKEYLSVKFIHHKEKDAHDMPNLGIELCVEKKCDFYLTLNSLAHLDNAHLLNMLIEQNRPVLSPFLNQPDAEINQDKSRGLWSVSFVSNVYLVRGDIIHNPKTKPYFTSAKSSDRDTTFSDKMRENNVDMYDTYRFYWGHVVSADQFNTNHLHNELYEMINNRWDWEQRYLHVNYSQNFDPKTDIEQPCYNVFWFPMLTDRFCDELIDELENSGKWTLVGDDSCMENNGHEALTNKEIHMYQIGMKKLWSRFIKQYIQPLQERVFEGFQGKNPPESTDYVIRYKPNDHPFIKPHHDASTYTTNIALNRAGIDYQGGGVRFIRENCSVVDSRKGWMLMHPGRLTHYHEALPTTKGTRYVFITMVDP